MKSGFFKFIFLSAFFFSHLPSFTQTQKIDSLLKVLEVTKEDSAKVTLLRKISFELRVNDPDKAAEYSKQALQISKLSKYKRGESIAYNSLGLAFFYKSEFDSAIYYYKQAFAIAEALSDSSLIAVSYNSLGNVYKVLKNYLLSIDYHKKCLAIREKDSDTSLVSQSYMNLGNVYVRAQQMDKALECFFKLIELQKKNKGFEYASALNGIANVYNYQKNYLESINYYHLSLDEYKKAGDDRGVAVAYQNIAAAYIELGQPSSGLPFLNKSIEMREKIGNKLFLVEGYSVACQLYERMNDPDKTIEYAIKTVGFFRENKIYDELAEMNVHLALAYYKKKNFTAGDSYLNNALFFSDSLTNAESKTNFFRLISEVYSEKGDYKTAYDNLLKSYNLNDSIFTIGGQQTLAQMQTAFDVKENEKEIDLLEKKDELKEEKLQKQNNIILFFIIGSILFLLLVFFIYRGYRKSKQANAELSKAYDVIGEKNKNISDSIQYAKNIQGALLKVPSYFDKSLKNQYFIFYRPKDVVSGDFYWIEQFEKVVLVAAADCTGHGVPGSLMSMLAMEKLKQAVREKKLTDPAEILSFVNRSFKETFSSAETGKEVRDGMDIALCCLNLPEKSMTYAGANRPLWIATTEDGKRVLNSIKPTKAAIGGFTEEDQLFNSFKYFPKKDDMVYIFTDGFADQFGGDDNKKYNLKRFHSLLLSISELPMNEQKKKLELAFDYWKGSNEQVDDVLIIGMTKD